MNNYPVNQVFLGGGDPFLGNQGDIDTQLSTLKMYEEKLNMLRNRQSQLKNQDNTIWNSIDQEIQPLTDDQKKKLFNNSDYIRINNQLQSLVQAELLNLVKSKIENSEGGKELLKSQLKLVQENKKTIIQESNNEIELFRKFKEFSKSNPNVTYEEFLKNNI